MRITDVCLKVRTLGNETGAEPLKAMMDRFGIDRGVICHELAELDPKTGNERMSSIAEESGGRILPMILLDPALNEECLPGTGSLPERIRAYRPAATVVSPELCRAVFTPFYWDAILSSVNECELPLFVMQTYDDELFRHLPEIASMYPDVKFVLHGFGLTGSRIVFPLLEKTENVFFTVTKMMDYRQIEEITERGFVSRLLFSGGYPENPPEGALGLIRFAEITDREKQMIFSENWEAISG